MKILAVSTAEKECSMALMDDQNPVCEEMWATRQTHSKRIMGMVDSIIERSGFGIEDLDGFIAAKGPGSFTGLRIGISTVKGLGYAMGKPCEGVSSLDGIAWQFSFSSLPVCVMMDAQRAEVYHATYYFKNGTLLKKTSEKAVDPVKVLAELKEDTLFAGSGAVAYKDMIKAEFLQVANFVPLFQNKVRASVLAESFFRESSGFDLKTPLVPEYLRKSDAEINKNRH